MVRWVLCAMSALASLALGASAAPAETLKVGHTLAAPVAPIFIAKEMGYYAAEGLDVELVPFDAAGPIAVGLAAGSIDFGLAGSTASFFNLAAHGQVQIIAGAVHEMPGWHAEAVVATNKGAAAGIHSVKDLGSRSIAMSQLGSSFYYALGLITDKYGIDLKSIRIVQTQSNANTVSAVAGNQVEAALGTFTGFTPLIAKNEAKLLAYVGDETPWQAAFVITSTKLAHDNPDIVARWLKAFRNATRDYHDAFTNAAGAREDQPGAAKMLAIIAKYIHQTPDQIRPSIGYIDAEARLDVKDVERQIAWYRAQGMIKGDAGADSIIASRYVIPWNGK